MPGYPPAKELMAQIEAALAPKLLAAWDEALLPLRLAIEQQLAQVLNQPRMKDHPWLPICRAVQK